MKTVVAASRELQQSGRSRTSPQRTGGAQALPQLIAGVLKTHASHSAEWGRVEGSRSSHKWQGWFFVCWSARSLSWATSKRWISVAKLCSSVHMAVGNKWLPASRNENVVKCFPGSAIWAVPCSVMDQFLRQPGISNTEVVVAAEKKVVSVVACGPVSKSCANNCCAGHGSIGYLHLAG